MTAAPPPELPPRATPATLQPEALPRRPQPSIRQRIRQAPATYSLIALTAFVFAAQQASIVLLGYDLVLGLGAKHNQWIAGGEVWRLVTPLFLHVGLWHVLVNMYSLSVLGPGVERLFGSARFLVVYLLSGIAGVLASLAFNPLPSAGASGAIFGLLGAYGSFLVIHRQVLGPMGEMQLRRVVLVALLNLVLGLMPSIDNWGHVGGLVAGAALSWSIGPRFEVVWIEIGRVTLSDRRPWRSVRWRAAVAAALMLPLGLLALHSPLAS